MTVYFLITTAWLNCGVPLILMFYMMHGRWVVRRKKGIHDLALVIAMIFSVALSITLTSATLHRYLGESQLTLQQELIFATHLLSFSSNGFSTLSAALFTLKFGTNVLRLEYGSYSLIVFTIAWTLFAILSLVLVCIDNATSPWDFSSQCSDRQKFYTASTALNLAVQLAISIYPASIILRTQQPLRVKFLPILRCLGPLLTIPVCIAQLVLINQQDIPTDFVVDVRFMITVTVIPNLSIVASCILLWNYCVVGNKSIPSQSVVQYGQSREWRRVNGDLPTRGERRSYAPQDTSVEESDATS